MPDSSNDPAAVGLAGLASRSLTPAHEAELSAWVERSLGSNVWRRRKAEELRELFALSEIAPRFRVRQVDLRTDLRVLVSLACPVPCLTPPETEIRIEREAILAISWPEEAIRTPLPAYSFVVVHEPRDVLHPNVVQGPVQALCLGTHLPVGLPVREIVLMSYGALSMQSVMLDEQDPAGVMSAGAARFWQARTDLIPLSDVPFLGTADLEKP